MTVQMMNVVFDGRRGTTGASGRSRLTVVATVLQIILRSGPGRRPDARRGRRERRPQGSRPPATACVAGGRVDDGRGSAGRSEGQLVEDGVPPGEGLVVGGAVLGGVEVLD